MKRLISSALIVCLTACSSTTVIESMPSGAALYLNGERAGNTPYVLTDTRIMGSPNSVILKQDGYQDFVTEFRRNEEANVGAIVAGCFVLVPFLWAMGYKDKHTYEMVPASTTAGQDQRH